MLRGLIFTFLFLLASRMSFAVPLDVYARLDSQARYLPEKSAKSIASLASSLSMLGESDSAKVRAIYAWVATHVDYDADLAFSGNGMFLSNSKQVDQRLEAQNPEMVLKHRKAICQGYANLVKALCKQINIPAFVVTGYDKGYFYQSTGKVLLSHAWNAVRIHGTWRLLDATWASGYVSQERKFVAQYSGEYFLPSPAQFARKHLPADPIFQLLSNHLSLAVFSKSDESIVSFNSTYNAKPSILLQDSLFLEYALPDELQVYRSAQRASRFNPQNGLALLKLSEYHASYALSAFERFNKATTGYNNKTLPNQQVYLALLDTLERNLIISKAYLSQIASTDQAMYKVAKANQDLMDTNLSVLKRTRKYWFSI